MAHVSDILPSFNERFTVGSISLIRPIGSGNDNNNDDIDGLTPPDTTVPSDHPDYNLYQQYRTHQLQMKFNLITHCRSGKFSGSEYSAENTSQVWNELVNIILERLNNLEKIKDAGGIDGITPLDLPIEDTEEEPSSNAAYLQYSMLGYHGLLLLFLMIISTIIL